MLKEVAYVHTLGNPYLLDALVMHIYKNVLYWKLLLTTKRVMLYRSPSQKPDEFDPFINNFEKPIIDIYSRKADFVLIVGDFNAKSF